MLGPGSPGANGLSGGVGCAARLRVHLGASFFGWPQPKGARLPSGDQEVVISSQIWGDFRKLGILRVFGELLETFWESRGFTMASAKEKEAKR